MSFRQETLYTKSFWTGLTMVISGMGMCIMGDPATGIQTMAGGIVTIFVRDAISKIQPAGR